MVDTWLDTAPVGSRLTEEADFLLPRNRILLSPTEPLISSVEGKAYTYILDTVGIDRGVGSCR